MKELYIEGVATHDDPEPGAGVHKGVSEALECGPKGRRSSGCKSRQRGLPSQRCSDSGRSYEVTQWA